MSISNFLDYPDNVARDPRPKYALSDSVVGQIVSAQPYPFKSYLKTRNPTTRTA